MEHCQRYLIRIIGGIVILIIAIVMAYAGVPHKINFQGKLIEDDVAVTGFRSMTFSLWDSDTGGPPASAIWSETQTSVEIIEGIYNVQLGSVNSLPVYLYNYSQLYLQIDLVHPTEGSQRLSPLLEITSTVFALKAGDADMLEGKTAADFAEPVHGHTWSEISNRPAGLDDGDDVGITSETDPTVLASVKNGVSWSEVSGKPAGFADNVDDDSGGDITGVTAGDGLSGGGTSGAVELKLDIPYYEAWYHTVIAGNYSMYLTASCPSGYRATGGGWDQDNGSGGRTQHMHAFMNRRWGDGWRVGIRNDSSSYYTVYVYAICMKVN